MCNLCLLRCVVRNDEPILWRAGCRGALGFVLFGLGLTVWIRRLVWGVVSTALVAGMGVFGPAWADPVVESEAVVSRPDWTSAGVTAKAQGVRVEVLSERSETTRVWIHPDGVVEEEAALGEVRFQDELAADGWRDIDTTLVARSDGSIRPKAVPVEVEVQNTDTTEAKRCLAEFSEG